MLRVGDDTAGFSVDFPATGGTLVTGWGFWSVEVALAFATIVGDACRSRKRRVSLMLDMRELKPMRKEGQQSFSEVLRSLQNLGISRVSVVTTNALTKIQLVRLASECAADNIEWINATNGQGRDAGDAGAA
jgi:hypothetical protein